MAVAFGRYELLKKIASGGMGQVFLARTATQGFQKLVVIKRILPHLVEDEEFLTMFFDEAQIAGRLNHPNLIQIFDLGEQNGMHYLAMEYLAGDDVRRVEKAARKQNLSMPLGVACRIVSDAAAGLDYAHKLRDARGEPLNLIHRDVSPQNILVGFDGGVKLIDFGVARAAGRAQHTATGMLKGKYPYMSPEQITGEAYDHRSDQFALGTVFWEILTGRRLFKGDSDLVTMRLVRECQVPLPSGLNPALPKGLDAIVLKALAPRPEQRFADCGEFRMALEEFMLREHLAASSAHLSAFMRDLYRERIEREADTSNLDELSGASAFEEDSASESKSLQQLAPPPPAQTKAATRATANHFTQPLSPGGGRRKVPLWLAGAVVAISASVAAVPLFILDDRKPAPVEAQLITEVIPSPTPAEPPPKQSDPVPTPAPVAPAPLRIQLTSRPTGAQVAIDGQKLGETPLEYAWPAGLTRATAVFSKAGYESETAVLTAEAGPELSVELKRKKRPAKSEPALQIKTGR